MRYKIKQWFTVLLSIVMIISMLPVTAMAESVIPTKETKIEQVQALIDALPDAEEITSDNRTEIQEEIDSIAEAMLGFTEEEAAELDTTRYDAAVAALHALDTNPVSEPSALEQVQSLIDALPDADSITEENRADVEAQLSAIDEAKLDLTDDERSALDTTRYDSAVSTLLALDGQDGDVPMPIDWVNGFEWTFDGINTVTLTGEGELNLSGQRFPFGTTKIIVNGATSIAEGCFRDWTNLLSVTLSDSVTTIGKEAFHGCTYLRQLQLPAGVTSIGESAFGSCEFLALTELPASLQVISNHAFDGCYELALTEIPEGVTSIGGFAFDFCKSLTHLTLPASLASMDYYVFQGCENLTSLTFLGTTAPSIDSLTFANADALQEILIPAGAKGYDAPGWPQDKIKTGYKVTVNSAFGGYASASADFASAGTQINLTATPEDGYHFKEWQTEPKVTVTDNSFTMPARDVTVMPVFEPHTFSSDWETSTEKHWHECACGEKNEESEHIYKDGVCTTCGYSFEGSIFYKSLSGKNIELHMQSTDTVLSVKEKIRANEGIPVSMQVLKLSTSSAELEDDKCLADCGVRKDSTLHLILRYAPGGNGTAGDPYLISDVEQLEAFQYYINNMVSDGGEGKYFKLTADIDLEDKEWTPIRGYAGGFAGVFDGGGHTIRGLKINETSTGREKLGFFRTILEGGTVKNLTVAGSVTGGSYTGGVAGENSGTVDNCRNTCTVSAADGFAGGVVGCNIGYGTVKNCSNTGAVAGEDAGGVVGQNESTVERCSNAGPVTGNFAGGVVGANEYSGTVKNCSNTGTVTGGCAGGIVNGNDSSTVENCYNSGTVTGRSVSGVVRSTFFGTIKNCYNTGTVSGSEDAAGIVRDNYYSVIENCYNTGTVTGESVGGVVIGNYESVIENCYYLNACGAAGEGTPKTAEQFASGEVAYLLQREQDDQVWGQTVGSGTPELTAIPEKKVFQITGEIEGQENLVWYSNREATLPAAPERPGFAFEGWSMTKGGSVDFTAGATVSEDRTVYAVFTDKRLDGTGSVTMADYTCGDNSVNPVAVSATNGTANVTFTYSVRGRDEFSETKPTTAGEYTVKAVFAATDAYHAVTATADFRITHQFNAGWEHRDDGEYHLCACGVGLLLEEKELTEVPEGLKENPDTDTLEEIERILSEKVATGEHYAIYDVELEALIDGEWVIVTPENFPKEGVAITIPYPEGTNAKYSFTVVHMFTTTSGGHVPGDTEILEATNGPDGIHFTVKSLSPIAIGWKTGNLTVTVTDTGESADPAQWWQFRVELSDQTIRGEYGDMNFTDGVAEFTLRSGQSLTAQDLPEGVTYTVTELNGNQNGYTTTYTDDSGFITSEKDMVAAFVNDKPAPTQPDKPSDDPDDKLDTPSDTPPDNPPENSSDKPSDNTPNEPSDNPSGTPSDNDSVNTPKTGDESHLSLWFLLMILSLIGITVIVLTPIIRRKKLVSTNGRHMRK